MCTVKERVRFAVYEVLPKIFENSLHQTMQSMMTLHNVITSR